FEIVFTRFLDLAALDPDVVDGELLRTNQMRKVEPERGDVAGHFAGVLLEGHEDARLVEIQHAVDEKCKAEQRLAGSRPAADKRRPPLRQPAERDLVEAPDAGGTLRQAVSESGIGEKGEIGLLLHGASPVSVRT